MNINSDSIISGDAIPIDVESVNMKLEQRPELVVFDSNRPQFVIMTIDRYDELSGRRLPSRTAARSDGFVFEEKIGKYVQDTMRSLSSENALTGEELNNLLSAEYSSRTFGISYPVLRKFDGTLSMDQQKRDDRGYSRYYNYTLQFQSEDYLLCSQWVERLHRDRYMAWYDKIKEA